MFTFSIHFFLTIRNKQPLLKTANLVNPSSEHLEHHALVPRKYLVPFFLIASLFFLWGAAHAILDVLNKHFQEVMHMSRTHSSMVQVMFYLGYFVMAIPAGLVINRFGYRRGVITGLLLYGIGALMFWPGSLMGTSAFTFFLFSLFVIACGLAFLETAANPYVTELGHPSTAASRLNLAQSLNGLGCICGPLVGGLLLFGEGGEGRIALPYVVMGILVLTVAFTFTRVRLPEISHTTDHEAAEAEVPTGTPTLKQRLAALFSHKIYLFGIVALLSYEVSEIGINSFFINYVTDEGWMNPRDASIALSFGGLGLFMLGRLSGGLIMQHISSTTLLRICALGTMLTTTLVVLHLGTLSLMGLVLIYVFESIMFPTIFALSLRGLGSNTKIASSFLMMTPVGGAIGPLLMGLVADTHGMSASFTVPLVGFLIVAAYAFKVEK